MKDSVPLLDHSSQLSLTPTPPLPQFATMVFDDPFPVGYTHASIAKFTPDAVKLKAEFAGTVAYWFAPLRRKYPGSLDTNCGLFDTVASRPFSQRFLQVPPDPP